MPIHNSFQQEVQYHYAPQSNYNNLNNFMHGNGKGNVNMDNSKFAANYNNPSIPSIPPNNSYFGPKRVLNIKIIRCSLGFDNLTESDILRLSSEACLYGEQIESINALSGEREWKFIYNHMIFVLSEGFDAVVTIVWNNQIPQTVGDNTNNLTSTFHDNTHHLNQKSITQSNQFIASSAYNTQNRTQQTIDTNLGSFGPDQDQYECIIDDIIKFVDNDIIDPPLPSLPAAAPAPPTNYQYCYDQNTLPSTSTHIGTNYSSFIEDGAITNGHMINSEINTNSIQNGVGIVYGTSLGSNGTTSDHSVSSCESDPNINHGIEILISSHLWQQLYSRFGGNGGPFTNKLSLIRKIQNAIHVSRAPMHRMINNRYCVWIDNDYVYITESDMSTLVDIFDYKTFQTNYGQCYSLLNNKINKVPPPQIQTISSGRTLIKNSSKRSINTVSSKRSVFSDMSAASNLAEYHTIYLKPIIERMKSILYNISIDSDYILEIVDSSIKNGKKRQISKRTFEFKWANYTIIMSKSLKTILDVTRSTDKDIITVHPDVVSIISKKCPVLDYFTIQKLANKAKLTRTFTTKKK
eukprot:197853_1